MTEQEPAGTSVTAKSLFLVAHALGRRSLRPLRSFASGSVDRVLAETEELLHGAGPGLAGELRAEAADVLLRRNLPAAFIHPSWFIEPLRALPAAMLTPVLSLLPLRLMRCVAELMEERLGLRFGRITLNELSPALARRFALSLLPPWADPSAAGRLPRALVTGPLAELERRPFPLPQHPDVGAAENMRAGAQLRLQEEAGLPAPLARSLTGLALALASRPDEAAALALRMPRTAGRVFLALSRESALLIGSVGAEAMDETFREYVENDL